MRFIDGDRAVDAYALAVQLRFGHRPRIERAHLVRQHRRRLRPVQPGLGLVDLVRVGDALQRLWMRRQGDRRAQQAERIGQHLRAEFGQAVVQLAAGFVRTDVGVLRQQHRAGIQALLHLHQADAAAGVAGLDRALDRRRTAPARQQRGMHVPTAVQRDVEHRLRQDQAIGHHHHQVGLERTQRLFRNGGPEVFRLQHRDAALHRLPLDRRRGQPATTACRAVRLGVDGHHLGLVRGGAQAGHGEFRRAGEDDAHRNTPRFRQRVRRRACAPWPASSSPSRA